ncbi:DUF1636 domain-containing protein [Rhodobacteraceae bacterium M382]|nr:DUF1636 domain-containing protein [Rhodobacteraceae bacterium M382]
MMAKKGQVTLTICTTCRRGEMSDPEAKRPGTEMYEALQAFDLPDNISLRPAECLSACTRGCSMALTGGPARWSYVYGDMDPAQHAEDIIAGVTAYANTDNGLVPWRERPVVFRKQSIARIPPAEMPTEE